MRRKDLKKTFKLIPHEKVLRQAVFTACGAPLPRGADAVAHMLLH